MASNRGVYVDGPLPYHGGDPNRDLATVLSVPQQLVQDLTGGSNLVISGFALTVVSGMQLLVGAGVCWANGLRAATAPTTLTLNTTGAQPRYTILRVTVTPNNPVGTDGTTGNNLIADTNVVDFVDGTPGASPAKPTLGSAYQVQVGSVLLPASTSALTSGMLNALDCAPNGVGPDGSELVSSFTHRQASLATAAVHGYQATAPGGADLGRLAATDGTFGAVGRALALYSAGRGFLNSDAFDASGAAAAVTAALGTETTNRTAADATLTTNLGAHSGATVTSGNVHGLRLQVVTLAGIFATSGANPTIVNFTFGPFTSVSGGWANFTGDTNVNDDFTNPEVSFSDTGHGSLRFKTGGTWTGSAQVLVLGT